MRWIGLGRESPERDTDGYVGKIREMMEFSIHEIVTSGPPFGEKKKKSQSLPHIRCRNNSYLIKKLDIKDKSRKHWKLPSVVLDMTLNEVILKSCNIRTIVSSGDT